MKALPKGVAAEQYMSSAATLFTTLKYFTCNPINRDVRSTSAKKRRRHRKRSKPQKFLPELLGFQIFN
jgi:hypothetical protein